MSTKISMCMFHGTDNRTLDLIRASGNVFGWWSVSFDLSCRYSWEKVRKEATDIPFGVDLRTYVLDAEDAIRPIIIEGMIPVRLMKKHARIAYYPRKTHEGIPVEYITAIWKWKPPEGFNFRCVQRMWDRQVFE